VFVLLAAQSAFAVVATGGIQGTLRISGGSLSTYSSVEVRAAADDAAVTSGWTGNTGTWSVSVPAGTYKVYAHGMNVAYAPGYWRSGANLTPFQALGTTITVSDGATQSCDATVPYAASLSGTITCGGLPAATDVDTYIWNTVSSAWESYRAGTSGANGAYSQWELMPGYLYTFKFGGTGGYAPLYYINKTSLAAADSVNISAALKYNFSPILQAAGGSGIHGVVHRTDGSPAANTYQYFYTATGGRAGSFVGMKMTASDGTFDATLTPGTYKVFVRGGNPYAGGWWAPVGPDSLASRGETVTVSEGTTQTIEATLPVAATIAGAIRARATGSPIPTAAVTPYVLNAGTGQWEAMFGTSAYGGAYSLAELLPNTYRLLYEAQDARYATQFWNGKPVLASADGISLTVGQHLTGYDVSLNAIVTSETVAGLGRIDTAIDASKKMYPDATTHADAVIITNGYNWPDALGGSALAGAANAPVLLNGAPPAAMNTVLDAEVLRLKNNGATDAYILGDANAVSAAVETRLATIFGGAAKVHRLGATGHSRYATSLDIANKVQTLKGAGVTVFLAKGLDYPDALAASPLAAKKGWPILLAETDASGALSARMRSFLDANANHVIILGSTNAVSSKVASSTELEVGAGNVERWSGADRIATAIDIADHSVANGMSYDGIGIATGYGFADALCGGAYLAKQNNPLLLSANALPLRPALGAKLTALSPEVATVRFLGGTPAIRQPVRDAIVDNLR
jgi:putative cell wall-binding protein